jgi:hypothetical protein
MTISLFWAPGRATPGSALLRLFAPAKAGAKEPNPSCLWRGIRHLEFSSEKNDFGLLIN